MKNCIRDISLFILFLLACGCAQRQSTASDPAVSEADRLLLEADSLMRADTSFYFTVTDRRTERCAAADSLIRSKLDSAVAIAPHYAKAYTGKLLYLGQCYKFRESLVVLRLMNANADTPMNADIMGMKAMLEDVIGDSIIARMDFMAAEEAYAVLEKRYRKDPNYIGYRFNLMLNRSLMENDFSILREDMDRVKDYSSVEGIGQYGNFENKEDFYRYLFPVLFNGDTDK